MNTTYLLFVIIALLTGMNPVHASEVTDLRSYLSERKQTLGASNIGYHANATGNVCHAMKSVGLGCSYNERGDLTEFLARNGVSLFPCKGNTNPYYNTWQPEGSVGNCARHSPTEVDNYYIGTAQQNAMLAASIRKNQQLFKSGNLTSADAKKWRP